MVDSKSEAPLSREDRRSASFALNLFQFASCGSCWSAPREPTIAPFPPGIAGKHPNAAWMGDLVERETKHGVSYRNRATLKRLVVPGSHDSASYSIRETAPCSAVGRTQNLTIREQLLAGIRFFDLRIASGRNKKGVNIYHGLLRGAPFDEILDDISSFYKEYPTEFVVLLVEAEYGRPFTPEGKEMALNMLRSCLGSPNDNLGDRLLCKITPRSDIVNIPLQDLIKDKGRVFVLLSSFDNFDVNGVNYDRDYVQKEYGFFNSTQWLKNKWHNTMDREILKQSNLKEIQMHNVNKRRQIVNNQFVLTPTSKFGDICGDICSLLSGSKTLQPVQLANRELYQPPRGNNGTGVPFIHDIFLNHSEEDWNVVSLDVVDLAPSIVDLCIGFNFQAFEIHMALLGNGGGKRSVKDVTKDVQKMVLRGTCLFLHPMKDFKSEAYRLPELALTIVYKISETMYSIVIPFSKEKAVQVVLLNEHNHLLAGGSEISLGEKIRGTLAPQDSGVIITWQKTNQMNFQFAFVDEEENIEDTKTINKESAIVPQ